MSAAFTLTMAYLSEQNTGAATAGALAAYITGNVASNLVGRLVSSAVASTAGVAVNFYAFAVLNLAGAALVYLTLSQAPAMAAAAAEMRRSALPRIAAHFTNRCLVASFGIGFFVLFAFLGTFTYVNFVLAEPPLRLSSMALGLVYFVFLPSMITTPLAGGVASRFGPRPTFFGSLGLAVAGLPLLLADTIIPVIAGLTLVAVGTFFAQATATGFVGRAARDDRAAASGIYLASYYLGGLAGAAVIGQIYDRSGWPAAVGVVGASLVTAAALAATLRPATAGRATPAAAQAA